MSSSSSSFGNIDGRTVLVLGVTLVGAALALVALNTTWDSSSGTTNNGSNNNTNKNNKKATKIKTNKTHSTNKNNNTPDSDDDNDVLFSSNENLKGYKTTSTGKKTTYFNRELSPADKALLGDCTPKRIDSTGSLQVPSTPPRLLSTTGIGGGSGSGGSPAPVGAGSPSPVRVDSPSSSSSSNNSSSGSGSSGTSVWNSAGTWEEKNYTSWVHKTLRKTLLDFCYTYEFDYNKKTKCELTELLSEYPCIQEQAQHFSLRFTAVHSITGDANITHTRNKKLLVYDLTVTLQWRIRLTPAAVTILGTTAPIEVCGGMRVWDISPDDDHFEYEITEISFTYGVSTTAGGSGSSSSSSSSGGRGGYKLTKDGEKRMKNAVILVSPKYKALQCLHSLPNGNNSNSNSNSNCGCSNLKQQFVVAFALFLQTYRQQE